MILGFNKQFKEPILNGSKIHTIRADKNNRWKKGNKIHFATGVRTKDYSQFKFGECKSVQYLRIDYPKCEITGQPIHAPTVQIDNQYITSEEIQELALKDGFKNKADFFKWFKDDFEGVLIHWTNFKY
ncbi:hypothetical protein JCM19294_1154 [Nonlabens tegetincola]|uniref:ASCH domain-containing protein n=1 Tax=Nonlabens tegetincola TaxID=323273 RepID=A0A090Q1C9_9FLAO|nr:hypothetical protein [Nonlabens tegetincola]GAK96845.1 hypothetical protein JCM19294_1154 [Nonlabens tegetincola]